MFYMFVIQFSELNLCVVHLVFLQLLGHFIHVPIILRYQRSHNAATQMDDS